MLAFVVYFCLLLHSLLYSIIYQYEYKKLRSYWNLYIVIPIVVVSVVLGVRLGVGIDYDHYKNLYLNQLIYSYSISQFEPIYKSINQILFYWKLPYPILFIVILCIQQFFFYKTFKNMPYLLPWGVLSVFVLGTIFEQLNIMRQATAFYIFLSSIQYIKQRKLWKYISYILLAIGFHYTSVILLPLYFIGRIRRTFWDDYRLGLIIYVVTLLGGAYIFDNLLIIIQEVFSQTPYFNYAPNLGIWMMEVHSGLGVLLFNLIDIILIFYSRRLIQIYQKEGFIIYYRFYFLGILFANIVGLDMVLARVPFALESLRFVILAFCLDYVYRSWHTQNKYVRFCFCTMILVLLLVFVVDINNGSAGCAPYFFYGF